MRYRPGAGFALIEATMAVAVISLVALGTSFLLSRLPVGGREARDQDAALRIAKNELESLSAGGYGALPTSTPMAFSDALLSSLASSSASVSVGAYATSTKRVDVTVSWRGASGMRSLTLTTLVSESAELP